MGATMALRVLVRREKEKDFPGKLIVKNPLTKGCGVSIPVGELRFHMPCSNSACVHSTRRPVCCSEDDMAQRASLP